jgi:hypothetical protein
MSQSKDPKVFLWHDPAHVLLGICAVRQPKSFGAFLDPIRTFESRVILCDAIALVFGRTPARYQ